MFWKSFARCRFEFWNYSARIGGRLRKIENHIPAAQANYGHSIWTCLDYRCIKWTIGAVVIANFTNEVQAKSKWPKPNFLGSKFFGAALVRTSNQ